MSTLEILDQIGKLSPVERLFVIEKALKDILRNQSSQQMNIAAEALENEYRTNQELTAFTSIDLEDFYEAK